MLCGLIWRQRAKDLRSITSWREEKKGLPSHSTGGTFRSSLFGGAAARAASPNEFGEKGYPVAPGRRVMVPCISGGRQPFDQWMGDDSVEVAIRDSPGRKLFSEGLGGGLVNVRL